MPLRVFQLGLDLTVASGFEDELIETLETHAAFEELEIDGQVVRFYSDSSWPWFGAFDSFKIRGRKLCPYRQMDGTVNAGSKCGYIFPGGIQEMVAHRVLHGFTSDSFVYGANNNYEVLLNNVACKIGFDLDAKVKGLAVLRRLYPDTWEKLATDSDAFLTLTIPVTVAFINHLIDKRNALGGDIVKHVNASDLMVSSSSAPYDPEDRDRILQSGILSFHLAIPSLYLADYNHRSVFVEELNDFADTKRLDHIFDFSVYSSKRKMRLLGAQKIDGRPMIPIAGYTDSTTGEYIPFASQDGVGDDWWDLSVETVCDHAWSFVDPKRSTSIFRAERVARHLIHPKASSTPYMGAPRPCRNYAGTLLSAKAIEMVEVYKSFCVRHNVPFDANNFNIRETPGSVDDLPSLQLSMRNGQPRLCPVARTNHDSNSFKLVCTDGRVNYLCFGGPRGSKTALTCCAANGCDPPDDQPKTTNYVRNMNGSHKFCSRCYVGPLSRPMFDVPTDLELDTIVIASGKKRMAPIQSSSLFGRATELLREHGILRDSHCGVAIVRANMSSGKTYVFSRWLAHRARAALIGKQPMPRFVVAVPKKSLVASVYRELVAVFRTEGLYDFWTCQYGCRDGSTELDTDIMNPRINWAKDKIVCCTQSLPRLCRHDTIDVFMCDEICDATNQAACFKGRELVINALVDTMRDARKVVLLDAFADRDALQLCKFAGRPPVFFDCPDLRPFDGVTVNTIIPLSKSANGAHRLCPAYGVEYVIDRLNADPNLYVHVVVTTLADMQSMEARAKRAKLSHAIIYGDQPLEEKTKALASFEQSLPDADTPRLYITSPAVQGGVSNYFCDLVVTFLRGWSVSAYSIKQSESRCRDQVELMRIVMDPRLIFNGAPRAVYASERYCNYGLLDEDMKAKVDVQVWRAPHSELKLQAAKEGLGVQPELSGIARPSDYIYLPAKKKGVYERVYFDAPAPLVTPEEVDVERTKSDRWLHGLRTAEDNAPVADVHAITRHAVVDNASRFHAYFNRAAMLEMRNRSATMLADLARADRRLGLRGSIEAASFKVLDEETVQRIESELQTTRLLYQTKLLLTGINFFKEELYASTADATERHTHLVRLLKLEKDSGTSLTNKRKAVAMEPPRANTGFLSTVAELLRKYDALLEPKDIDGEHDDTTESMLDVDPDVEPYVVQDARLPRTLTTEADAMAKFIGLAVISFTKDKVDLVANGVCQAATEFNDGLCSTGPDAKKQVKETGAKLRKANEQWVMLFEDKPQNVFRALTVLEKLKAAHGEAKDGRGDYVYASSFREYVKTHALSGTGMKKGSEDLLDLVAADELLRTMGFKDGIFADASASVDSIIDDPSAPRFALQRNEDTVARETVRTAAIRAICKKLDDKPLANYAANLGRSAQRILKQKTRVLSWDVRAAQNGQGDESGLVHTGKKWSLVPSPLVAWCGPDTRGVTDAWGSLWADVRNA
jgi:hypothetical protein